MKAAIIPADDREPVRFEEIAGDVTDYQAIVGGDFQVLTLRRYAMSMYLNENGKLEGLPVNRRATVLAGWADAVRPGDLIPGDVLILGPIDDAGNDTGLHAPQEAWLDRPRTRTSRPVSFEDALHHPDVIDRAAASLRSAVGGPAHHDWAAEVRAALPTERNPA